MGTRQIVISSLLVTQMAFMLSAVGQGRPNIIIFVADDQIKAFLIMDFMGMILCQLRRLMRLQRSH